MAYDITNLDRVKSIISQLRESENVNRKNNVFEDYRVYSGDQIKLLEEKLRIEFPDSFDEMRPMEFNFCKKIVSKRAILYKDGVKRTILVNGKKDEKLQEVFDAVYKDIDADNMYKKSNIFYEFMSYLLPQIYLDSEKRLQSRVLPPYLYDVIPDLMGNPQVVALSHYVDKGTMKATSDSLTTETKVWTLWSKDKHVVVQEEVNISTKQKELTFLKVEGNDESVNPLGELSFVFSLKAPADGFYYPMRNPLSRQCFTLNLMISDIASIARTQGFGQAVLIAHSSVMPENVKVGIKSLIKIPIPEGETSGNTKFDFVNSNAPISEQIAAVGEFTGFLLTTNNLNADEISGKAEGSNVVNGISRLIESAKLVDSLDTTKSIFIKSEEDLFRLLDKWLTFLQSKGQLHRNYSGYRKEDDIEMRVDYLETKPIQGEEDKLNMIERKVELGLINAWQKHQIMNTDLTDKEAQAREEEIKAEKMEAFKDQQAFMMENKTEDSEEEDNEEEKKPNPFEDDKEKNDG